jgi:hypothetical protein
VLPKAAEFTMDIGQLSSKPFVVVCGLPELGRKKLNPLLLAG